MADKKERRGLGRGLSALMADVTPAPTPAEPTASSTTDAPVRADARIPIDRIRPNPDQPRRHFAEAALEELAASIREKGVLQPLIVRPNPTTPEEFQIVAGERRWRAAQVARLHDLPVVIRDFNDSEVLEVAIIENIQRADLNPVEEADGYKRLMDRFGHTQEELARILGKSRSHVANTLRLLNLPTEIRQMLSEGQLSAGHARALLGAPDPLTLARDVLRRGLSVRETERLAKSAAKPGSSAGQGGARGRVKDADTRALEADMMAVLRMGVSIDHKGPGGAVTIRYKSLDQLDELCQKLSALSDVRLT